MCRHSLLLLLWQLVVYVTSGFLATPSGRRIAARVDSNAFPVHSVSLQAALSKGDNVLVIGGTGGVGQLVTKKLIASGFSVTVSSRNVESAANTIVDPLVKLVPLDLVQGTSAEVEAAIQGQQAIVISVGTTAFPTLKWANGNTPQAIDKEAVTKIAKEAAALSGNLKKIVLLTSVGVDRTGEMPFVILNLFKVLDCKKVGEEAIKGSGVDYSIVRPGRLIGGPYTNPDFAKLMQIPGGAENGVDLARGDDLLGDCSRDACAEAVVQCLTNAASDNMDFSVVSNDQPALTADAWTQAFVDMQK